VIPRIAVQAVLVLYHCGLAESQTWQLLQAQVAALGPDFAFRLLVCDNAPSGEHAPPFPEWVEYVVAEENRGLAWAYNLGLARAVATGAGWLLTLDQDTSLPADFLAGMLALAGRLDADPPSPGKRIGAVVPQLVGAQGLVYSPVEVRRGTERMLPRGYVGLGPRDTRPYNSGAMLRVTAMMECEGYDTRFWLDYLDHATFHRLTERGYGIWVAGDLPVEHHLSLEEARAEIGERHFENFVKAESAFRDLHCSACEGMLFTLRLFLRSLNQRRRGDPDYFVRYTRAILNRRISMSKAQRLERWEQEMSMMQRPMQARVVPSGGKLTEEQAP